MPSILYNSTKVNLNQDQQVQQSDFNKKMKGKLGQLKPNIEYLQKDFNNEINKIFAKESQRIDLSKDNMNMRDAMKPTFGVFLNEGVILIYRVQSGRQDILEEIIKDSTLHYI
eukprot:403355339